MHAGVCSRMWRHVPACQTKVCACQHAMPPVATYPPTAAPCPPPPASEPRAPAPDLPAPAVEWCLAKWGQIGSVWHVGGGSLCSSYRCSGPCRTTAQHSTCEQQPQHASADPWGSWKWSATKTKLILASCTLPACRLASLWARPAPGLPAAHAALRRLPRHWAPVLQSTGRPRRCAPRPQPKP